MIMVCHASQSEFLVHGGQGGRLTHLPVKAVNNAIDKKTIPTVTGRRAGHATRLLDLRALMSLTLELRLADRFMPELRREVFNALATAPRNRVSAEGGFLTIDLRKPRRDLATSLRTLRRAREVVISDPETVGDPVFRGTRVPVHLIATLLGQGRLERRAPHRQRRLRRRHEQRQRLPQPLCNTAAARRLGHHRPERQPHGAAAAVPWCARRTSPVRGAGESRS
jgi:hypothetical protein